MRLRFPSPKPKNRFVPGLYLEALEWRDVPATILGWDFNGLSNYGPSPFTPTTADPALTQVVGLTRGSGVGTSGTAAGSAWGGVDWTATSASGALAANDFFDFGFTVPAGRTVSLNQLDPFNIRRSGTGPSNYQFLYSIDGGSTFIPIGSPATIGAVTTMPGNPQPAISLSGIPELQNIAAGTQVRFRGVLWGASGAGGTGYLNNFQAGNDFVLDGVVNTVAANQPPAVTLPGGAVNYTENDPATVLDAAATVTDPDSPNFDTGTLTVDFSANGTADDRLAIRNQGTGAGQIGVSGANVTFGGTVIGTFAGGTGTTPLVVTFNANATPTAVQALVRNVTFQNVSDNPATAARTVRFVVTDGAGGTSNTAAKTVNVAAVNDAPLLGGIPAPQTTTDNTDFLLLPGAFVTDPDSSVTVTVTYPAANGVFVNLGGFTGSAGSYTFTGTPQAATTALQGLTFRPTQNQVPPGQTVSTTFTVAVTDGVIPSPLSLTTQLTVTSVNDAPTITSNGGGATAAVSVPENTTAVTTVVATDPDGPTVTYSIVGGADAARFAINPTTGALTFIAAPDFENPTDAGLNNVYDVVVQASDGVGGTATQAIAVTVTDVTNGTISFSSATYSVAEGNSGTTQAVITVTYTGTGFASANFTTGNGTATAGVDYIAQTGTVFFTPTVNTVTILLTVNGDTDVESDETVILTLSNPANEATLGISTAVLTILNDDVAPNQAPVITAPAAVTTNEDTPFAFAGASAITVSDPDNTPGDLTTTLSLPAGRGTLSAGANGGGAVVTGSGTGSVVITGTAAAVNAALATLVYTPPADANSTTFGGPVPLTVTTADALGGTDTDTVGITVAPVNDAPAFTIGAGPTVPEDASAQTVGGFAAFSPGGGSDEAAQTAGYTVSNDNPALFSQQPAIAPDGTLTFTPAPDAFGTATVTVFVTDSGGAASGTQTFTITVTPVADTPNFPGATTREDTPAVITAGARNAADGPEVTAFQVTGITGGTLLANNTTPVNDGDFLPFGTGFTFVPSPDRNDAVGPSGFRVQASTDGTVAGLGGDVVPVVVTVAAVNDAPTLALAASPSATAAQDSGAFARPGFAQAAPGGGSDEAGQTLTFVVTSSNPALFAVQPSVAADGTLTFTPAPGASGTATVTVTVRDNGGTANGGVDTSAPQTFTITITPAPQPQPQPPAPPEPINVAAGAQFVAIGTDAGTPGVVRVLRAADRAFVRDVVPFAGYTGGVKVALGDVDGDGRDDLIVGTATQSSHVKVFDIQTGAELRSFFAFAGFTGGVDIAAGDVTGDGRADVVVGAGAGAPGGHVKVFDGATGAEVRSFFAFPGFLGGVKVAAGDMTGDGRADVAVLAVGFGSNGHVKAFDGATGAEVTSFFGYAGYAGDIDLAVGDADGDGRAEVITAAFNPAAGTHLKAFDRNARAVRSFFAPTASPSFQRSDQFPVPVPGTTARLGVGDVNNDRVLDYLLGSQPTAGVSRVMVVDGATERVLEVRTAFDPTFGLGVYVDL